MKREEDTGETQKGSGPERVGWGRTETPGGAALFPFFSPFVALSEFVGSISAPDSWQVTPCFDN